MRRGSRGIGGHTSPMNSARLPSQQASLAERVKALALALGFDRAGIAPLTTTRESAFFADWIARGHHGEMAYLARNIEKRVDPTLLFEGASCALVVALVYDSGRESVPRPGQGRIANYAGGDDYHDVMLERLRTVGDALEPLAQRAVRWRAYVDTGPVLERVLAAHAGLGWIGKNTCLIDTELGSYFFLGVLITNLDLAPDAQRTDHCGSCRACLDACPTDAFPEPHVIDATRCLSYTTIELRGAIPEPLRAGQGDWVFGCDICQQVCPWNSRSHRAIPPDGGGMRARLAPRPEWVAPTLAWLLALSEDAWRIATRRTALRRTKFRGLVRNALVAAGNARDPSLIALIERHAQGGDELLAEHARWALAQLAADPAE